MSTLRGEIEIAINRHSAENGSDTPDFILAEYLGDCLEAFDRAVRRRAQWYGRRDVPTGVVMVNTETGEDMAVSQVSLHVTVVPPRE